jgi:flagellar hook-associated protein 2
MSVSSVGIGSGILTSDLLDKLKSSDTEIRLTPIKTRINNTDNKIDDFAQLEIMIDDFEVLNNELKSNNLFGERITNTSNNNVIIEATNNTDIQSFSISNISLAKKDIFTTTPITNKNTNLIGLGTGVLNLNIAGNDYSIDYNTTDTLETINNKIKNIAGDSVNSTLIMVSDNSYELSIVANNTNQNITFTDSNQGTDNLSNILNFSELQNAKPATFKLNGIDIIRSNNSFNDLIEGVDIKLINDSLETTVVNIEQDNKQITDKLTEFFDLFNSINVKINNYTNKDSGSLNNESYIKSISKDLTNILLSFNTKNDNLIDYGIDIDKNGVISFDSNKFNQLLDADNNKVINFFTKTDNLFETLDIKLNNYTGYNKEFDNFSDNLINNKESNTKYYEKEKIRLDAKYEILKQQFIAYDAIINRMNSEFSSLESLIAQQNS